jgi:hypothetical protein
MSPSVSSEAENPGSVYVEYKFTSIEVSPTSVIVGGVRSLSSLSQEIIKIESRIKMYFGKLNFSIVLFFIKF